jgi:hypothetical protein
MIFFFIPIVHDSNRGCSILSLPTWKKNAILLTRYELNGFYIDIELCFFFYPIFDCTTAVRCFPLPKVKNGKFDPPACPRTWSPMGERCRAVCEPGFELPSGMPAETECGPGGRWINQAKRYECIGTHQYSSKKNRYTILNTWFLFSCFETIRWFREIRLYLP